MGLLVTTSIDQGLPPQQRPIIGITMGDPNGIGPELLLKAFHQPNLLQFITPVVYGSLKAINYYGRRYEIRIANLQRIRNARHATPNKVNFIECAPQFANVQPAQPAKDAGEVARRCLEYALRDIQKGFLNAIVTLPIDKHTIYSPKFPYKGHTELLKKVFQKEEVLMLMAYESLRVALLTVHIPLKKVPESLTAYNVYAAIKTLHQGLKQDFFIHQPNIAVLALNPHAGDRGLIGEEERIIEQGILRAKKENILVEGPFPADSFFATNKHRYFDGVLAMYHDQGLIPFKYISQNKGVNITLGLPIVRTAPDHGVAYDIAGTNSADPASFINALYYAAKLYKNRQEFNAMPPPLQPQDITQFMSPEEQAQSEEDQLQRLEDTKE